MSAFKAAFCFSARLAACGSLLSGHRRLSLKCGGDGKLADCPICRLFYLSLMVLALLAVPRVLAVGLLTRRLSLLSVARRLAKILRLALV